MPANEKHAHFDNVRERRAARLAKEAEEGPLELDNTVEVVEGEDDERAQSEPQASDSADSEDEAETDTQGLEKPLTYGAIDG